MKFCTIQIDPIYELEKLTINTISFNVRDWCLNDIERIQAIVRFLRTEIRQHRKKQGNIASEAMNRSYSENPF